MVVKSHRHQYLCTIHVVAVRLDAPFWYVIIHLSIEFCLTDCVKNTDPGLLRFCIYLDLLLPDHD